MHLTPIFLIITLLKTATILATPVCFNLPEPEPVICNCGLGDGIDVCTNGFPSNIHGEHIVNKGEGCSPLVVRPLEVPKPQTTLGAIATMLPTGGPCSCHTSLVKPAVLPKPQCGCVRVNTNQQQQIATINHQQQIVYGSKQTTCGGGQNIFTSTSSDSRPILVEEVMTNPSNPAQFIPADPVSLAVAYRQAQEHCHEHRHLEDKLAFGFRTLPKEIPRYRLNKIVKHVPEEDLFNINGQIVELKKVQCSHKSIDDEAAEELLAMAEESAEARETAEELNKVSLGQIGYAPAKINSATFVNVPMANPLEAVAEAVHDAVNKKSGACHDGFKSGSVVISQVPKPNPISMPLPLPEPCPSSGEEFDRFSQYKSLPGNSNYGYVSSSASSSSSVKNHATTHMIVQGGGCGQ